MAGTKTKKGQSGNAVQYVTRNQALKKLQLKLAEFRRLCILKGIHPREPKKKVQGQNKTYYHIKDINYLLHEPLLKKIRELYAYEKKVRRAKAKKNRDLAARLAERRPTYRLDHLVRERYPSFVDALRDLDDPLTMLHLFSVLPAEQTHSIPAAQVQTARRLVLEWQAWVVRAHALRKVFVSVKGYYYQAEVMGQAVTWLVPHQLAQVLPDDVDYRVMLTFLEFYQTLVQFVNFKLYHSLGLKYPPVLDSRLEAAAAGLAAVMKDLAGGAAAEAKQISSPAQQGEEGGAAGMAPGVQQRMMGLSEKVRQLEREIEGERPRGGEEGGGESSAEDEEAGADLEIDSGDDEEEEESEEEDDADEEEEGGEEADEGEEAAADPEDGDIAPPGPAGGAAAELAHADDVAAGLVGGAADVDGDDDAAVCASLFKGLVFFLGREVPREQLMMVIRAFGGEVAWEGEASPYPETHPGITHQVVDRPVLQQRLESREYVQPQWVFDSANFRVLVKPQLYAPGRAPPPHLSPFVAEEEEGYMPEYGRQLKQLQEAARAARKRRAGALIEGSFLEAEGEGGKGGEAGTVGEPEDELAAAEARHTAELAKELKASQQPGGGAVGGEVASDGGEEEEGEEVVEEGSQKRLSQKRAQPEDDSAALKDVMMTRKNRKMYQKMQRDREAKRQRVEQLEAKAQALKKKKK